MSIVLTVVSIVFWLAFWLALLLAPWWVRALIQSIRDWREAHR